MKVWRVANIMTLMAFIGTLGSGKTLGLTYWAARNYARGKTVYANYRLNFPFIPVTTPEQIEDMQEGFFAADELWTWADSRKIFSKQKRFVTPILSKSRKRGIEIGYTVQYFKQIDKRIRQVTDIVVMPQMDGNDPPQRCSFYIYEMPVMKLIKVIKIKTFPIFNLYDTNEEVSELDFKDKEKPEKVA